MSQSEDRIGLLSVRLVPVQVYTVPYLYSTYPKNFYHCYANQSNSSLISLNLNYFIYITTDSPLKE